MPQCFSGRFLNTRTFFKHKNVFLHNHVPIRKMKKSSIRVHTVVWAAAAPQKRQS